jgi:hypothetical protein
MACQAPCVAWLLVYDTQPLRSLSDICRLLWWVEYTAVLPAAMVAEPRSHNTQLTHLCRVSTQAAIDTAMGP